MMQTLGWVTPPLRVLSVCLFACFALSAIAFSQTNPDVTQFGHNINIGPDEQVSDVTCLGCNVRVQGHVAGDVTTLGGSVVIEENGQVGGDTTVVGGDVRLEQGVNVSGDVTVVGGSLRRATDATIGGEVTNLAGRAWLLLIFGLPLVILGGLLFLLVWLVRRLFRSAVPAAA
jgi:hypothetical protein